MKEQIELLTVDEFMNSLNHLIENVQKKWKKNRSELFIDEDDDGMPRIIYKVKKGTLFDCKHGDDRFIFASWLTFRNIAEAVDNE